MSWIFGPFTDTLIKSFSPQIFNFPTQINTRYRRPLPMVHCTVQAISIESVVSDAVVITVFESELSSVALLNLDKCIGGGLKSVLTAAQFNGKESELLIFPTLGS
ncbi:hypothetical protein EBR57_07715 [bacterium]|nr:hypothetical protein [bacterium]